MLHRTNYLSSSIHCANYMEIVNMQAAQKTLVADLNKTIILFTFLHLSLLLVVHFLIHV